MIKSSNLRFALAIGAIAFVAVPLASANAELILSDGAGNSVTVGSSTSQTGSVSILFAGCTAIACTFDGSIGNWDVNVSTGTAKPGQSPEIDLNSINDTTGGSKGQTLTMDWSANGFAPAAAGYELNIGGTLSTFGTLTAALYGGNSNTLLDQSNPVGTTLSFSNPPSAFSGTESAYLASLSPNPYSLTQVVTLSFGGNPGEGSFNYSVDAIPEPAGILLLGTAMLFTVSFIRRKRAAGKV